MSIKFFPFYIHLLIIQYLYLIEKLNKQLFFCSPKLHLCP